MPPLRKGLVKRKLNTEGDNVNKAEESSESEELILGELATEGDTTDSEQGEDQQSDTELDKVLFDGDNDSTFGDDADIEGDSDQSSELTDSEDDGTSEESVSSEEDAESGLGHTHSSAEEDQPAVSPTHPPARKVGARRSGLKKGGGEDVKSGLSDTHSSVEEATSPTSTAHPPARMVGARRSGRKKGGGEDVKSGLGDTHSSVQEATSPASTAHSPARKVGARRSVTNKGGDETAHALDQLQKQIDDSHISIQKDEYESGDSSDEEERRNTTGEVPAWWYRDYPHVGYDVDARRIMRPPQRDLIDDFLKKCEDPDFWRTVRDPSTGQDVVLSTEDLELLARIKEGRVPNPLHNEYEPWVEWFTRTVLATPLRGFPDHKRSFLPSRSEQRQVSRLVHALKMGWIKTRKQLADERRQKREKRFYDLWGSENASAGRGPHRPIPAPRRPPPAHHESYNPPPEYLLDSKEMKEWNKLSATPWKRKYTCLPARHDSLRRVPAYPRYVRERFLRCLDLYLAPRAIKMRLTISPSDLVPELPSPRSLQPFPTAEAVRYRGHTDCVRSCDLDPAGQYVVSGSDDGTVKVWECASGRCLRTVEVGEPVCCVRWTPSRGLSLVAVAAGARLLLVNPGADIGAAAAAARTDLLLREPPAASLPVEERVRTAVQWQTVTEEEWAKGVRVALLHFRPLMSVSWHGRGDYLAAVLRDAASRAVLVHQVSRRRSQLPFARSKGAVQTAHFHPTRPLLAVATQRAVRLYDLARQELVKKLTPGAQWLSSLAMHPAGDNLAVGSYDRKCVWFDLDMSSAPYRTLRVHGGAVRALAFHARYPLWASAGDDRYVLVSHAAVYADLLRDPLLVPLRRLPAPPPPPSSPLCVLDVRFHPTQPWLLAACADHTLVLYA